MPLECFYTLPDSLEEHRIIWRIEPRLWNHLHLLRQKIDPLAEFNEETLEAAIARYLFEQLQQHPEHKLFRMHWMAFLVRRCEKVSNQILSFLPINLRSGRFQDLFLMGYELASNPVDFFDKFDYQSAKLQYWYPTIKKFAAIKIKHILISKLKKNTGLKTLGITNLGLVARSTRKQVKEALQHSGYGEAKLSQYLLLWQCFQEFRNSISLGVNKFKPEHFQKMAERYREVLEELALPEVHKPDINGEEIKTWLEDIGTAIRQILDPPLYSLDQPLHTQSDDDISLLENISYQPIVDEEMNQTVAALREFISQLLEGLKETQEKQMLFLRYGLEMKQAQVGNELGGQTQYQVSRRLQKLHNRILLQILNWVRQHLDIEPSSEGLNEIEAVLCQYYSDQIDRFFQRAIQFFGRQSREVLKLFYLVRLSPPEIQNKISNSEAEVKELLEAMEQWLYSSMNEQIQAEIQLQFQPQGAAEKRITAITKTRLETILQLYLQ
jgi:hypothetical protein